MVKQALFVALACVLTLSSCNKKDDPQPAELDSNFRQHNSDLDFQKSESDQADSDIDDALKDIPGFGKTEIGRAHV